MSGSGGLRVGALLAAAALCGLVAIPATSGDREAPGEQLVARHRLPPEAIARYAAMARGDGRDDSERIQSMLADRSPWVGPGHRAGTGRNPYVLVLTVSGVARSAGDVQSHWQAGWEIVESPMASREVLLSLSGLARKRVTAGQPLTLSTRSAPVSFRGERQVAPMLGLVQARNFDIREVQLEVWSGRTPWAGPPEPVLPLALAGLGAASLLGWGAWQAWRRGIAKSALAASDHTDGDSAASLSSEAPPAPFRPTASHELRVFESLHDVLHDGLVVETQFDETRPPRRRSRG